MSHVKDQGLCTACHDAPATTTCRFCKTPLCDRCKGRQGNCVNRRRYLRDQRKARLKK